MYNIPMQEIQHSTENTPERAQQLLVDANNLREERQYTQALVAGGRALDIFLAVGKKAKAAEAASAQTLCLRNEASELPKNSPIRQVLLLEALQKGLDAVTIGKEGADETAVAIPLFNLAKVQEDLGDLESAVATYQEAVLAPLPQEFLAAPGVSADMHRHFTLALLAFTTEQGIADAEDERTLLSAVDAQREELAAMPDGYEKFVWTSGLEIGLARYWAPKDREKATAYATTAQNILVAHVGTYPKLATRQLQLDKFLRETGITLSS